MLDAKTASAPGSQSEEGSVGPALPDYTVAFNVAGLTPDRRQRLLDYIRQTGEPVRPGVVRCAATVRGPVGALNDIHGAQIYYIAREAVNNAVLHGNKKDASKWVEVEMERAEGALFIRVWDEGPGLDESCLRDPRSGENLFKPNGRGIFLIKQFVDDVAFLRDKPGRFGVQMRVNLVPGK